MIGTYYICNCRNRDWQDAMLTTDLSLIHIFRKAADGYRENNIPIDMVYMDIDYMEDYKDFTVNQENFPDFEAYVNEMKEKGIHLVPIIDAGVKVEAGYDVYEEGVEKNYFCKREDGSDFVSAVWPGWTHFPDVLNADARAWFGQKYERLISKGIDGFWKDVYKRQTMRFPLTGTLRTFTFKNNVRAGRTEPHMTEVTCFQTL